jgi:hypothetical protein
MALWIFIPTTAHDQFVSARLIFFSRAQIFPAAALIFSLRTAVLCLIFVAAVG